MDFSTCKASTYWDENESNRDFDRNISGLEKPETIASKPIRSYSKRSSKIKSLREKSQIQSDLEFLDITPPSKSAIISAENFINWLPEGCLEFSLAVSHSGEINIFFGEKENPLQIFFGDDGLVSFYGNFKGIELAGDDLDVRDFDYMKLLRMVDIR